MHCYNTPMPLWSFITIAAVLFLGAIALLYWGLWGDRSKGRLRCPKCWYDMTGSVEAGKLECPECGKDAGVEKRLKKNHRRWWAMVVAVVLVSVAVGFSYEGWNQWREEVARAEIRKELMKRVSELRELGEQIERGNLGSKEEDIYTLQLRLLKLKQDELREDKSNVEGDNDGRDK